MMVFSELEGLVYLCWAEASLRLRLTPQGILNLESVDILPWKNGSDLLWELAYKRQSFGVFVHSPDTTSVCPLHILEYFIRILQITVIVR